MSLSRSFILRTDAQAQALYAFLKANWRAMAEAGRPALVAVTEHKDTRSGQQNKLLHKLCGQVAKERQWAGQWLDTEDWKRLFVDLYAKVIKRSGGRVVPSLDYSGVVALGLQTRKFKIKEMNELIEFIYYWGAENGIKWEAEQERLWEQEAAANAKGRQPKIEKP
jgi:hypothetical protein